MGGRGGHCDSPRVIEIRRVSPDEYDAVGVLTVSDVPVRGEPADGHLLIRGQREALTTVLDVVMSLDR